MPDATDRLAGLTTELMLVPGLSGHEDRVRRTIAARLRSLGLATRTDVLGNLMATIEGDPAAPSVMLFAHADQLGFVVRRIEPDGFVRIERVGGVPVRALPAQPVLFCLGEERDVVGVIANKSHHATTPAEKNVVLPYPALHIDLGLESAAAVRALGIEVGTPVVYQPRALRLGPHRLAGTAVDDRAGCAVVIEAARALHAAGPRPTVHIVFSVQEEFSLKGAMTAAVALRPAIAIQVDLALASDTPEMQGWGEIVLGGGPAMSLYSFHGRGTLNGTIPHPALVRLFEESSAALGLPLQRTAHTGVLTDSAYVQLVGEGVACIDLCFPLRYSHSALEVCDLRDLRRLTDLLVGAIGRIGPAFSLDRDSVT